MTAQEAAKKLERLLGPKGAWRTSPKSPTADTKPTKEQLQDARGMAEVAKMEADARKRELLSDPEYVRLRNAQIAADKSLDHLRGLMISYRVTVGIDKGWCFEILEQGDNWAEVIRKLETKQAKQKVSA